MAQIENIGGTPILDIETFYADLAESARADKLATALAQAGCISWDKEGRYIKGPSIALVGIGGVPVSPDMLERYRNERSVIPAASAGMSYLNSRNKPLEELYDTVVGHGHFSIAHTTSANLLVAGVSMGVENEFNSQRDIMHLSRVTVARTGIQERPPIVVPREELLEPTKKIVTHIDEIVGSIATPNTLDEWEPRNLLYPGSKATLFLATASLRNFQKLVSQRHDGGKEVEYVKSLGHINNCLSTVWPELFGEKE